MGNVGDIERITQNREKGSKRKRKGVILMSQGMSLFI